MIARIAAIASRSHPASGPACPGRRSPRMLSSPVRHFTPCAPHAEPGHGRAVAGRNALPRRACHTQLRNSPYVNSPVRQFPVWQVPQSFPNAAILPCQHFPRRHLMRPSIGPDSACCSAKVRLGYCEMLTVAICRIARTWRVRLIRYFSWPAGSARPAQLASSVRTALAAGAHRQGRPSPSRISPASAPG